jgi:hypothetical protein
LIPAVESNQRFLGAWINLQFPFLTIAYTIATRRNWRNWPNTGYWLLHTPRRPRIFFKCLFGRLKTIRNRLLRDLSLGRDLGHVMCIFRAYERATTNVTVRNSWEKASFGIKRRDGVNCLFVHEGKIRGSTEFAEIWEIDYPEQSPSLRRRQQPRRLFNRHFFRVKFLKQFSHWC